MGQPPPADATSISDPDEGAEEIEDPLFLLRRWTHEHCERPVHGGSRFQLARYQGGGGLQAFFTPQNIAVIGATEKAGSVGRTIVLEPDQQPVRRDRLPGQPEAAERAGDQGLSAHRGRARPGRPGHRRHARADGAGPDRRVRRGRGPGGHRHLGRVQGDRGRGRGARAPDHGPGAARPDAGHRPELPGGDEPDAPA